LKLLPLPMEATCVELSTVGYRATRAIYPLKNHQPPGVAAQFVVQPVAMSLYG